MWPNNSHTATGADKLRNSPIKCETQTYSELKQEAQQGEENVNIFPPANALLEIHLLCCSSYCSETPSYYYYTKTHRGEAFKMTFIYTDQESVQACMCLK